MSSPESVGKYQREQDGQFPGRPIIPSLISQAATDFTKVNRRKRCGQCDACKVKENCNNCKNCLNRKILKQTCILRRCHFLHHKISNESLLAGGKRKKGDPGKGPAKRTSDPFDQSKTASPDKLIKIEPPAEPDISSSDEIEQAVNSLLEDRNQPPSEDEPIVPDEIIVRPPPPLSEHSAYRTAKPSFPASSEVLRSSSLLNKQNDTVSGMSYKIVQAPPVFGGVPHPYTYQSIPTHPVMVMGHKPADILRQNLVLTRMPMTIPNSSDVSQFSKFSDTPYGNHAVIISQPLSSGLPTFGNDYSVPKVHRRKRCGQCRPCQIKENCMSCKNCINRKVLKQTCVHRKCLFLREKMRKDSGFCSSPIVDQALPQHLPTQPQPFLDQLYEAPASAQSIQIHPTVLIAEHYDQLRPGIMQQNTKPGEISLSGHILSHPPVMQHAQHIQLWSHPYTGPAMQQGFPMLATQHCNYAVQIRPQHQLGGYMQATHLVNPADQQRYYMQPALASVNSFHELNPLNRAPARLSLRNDALSIEETVNSKPVIEETTSP